MVKQYRASYQSAISRYNKTILRSPINGVVTKLDTRLGEIVNSNQVITSVISESKFQIEAYISEVDIRKVKEGASVKTTLDAYGDSEVFEAVVTFVDPAEEIRESVPTYKTTFEFLKEDERIKSGMTANLIIQGEKKESVLSIPKRSTFRKDGQVFVFKFQEDKYIDVKISLGFVSSDGYVEVKEGLNEGDKIVLNP